MHRLQGQVRQSTRLTNQLHNLLARVFPELALLAADRRRYLLMGLLLGLAVVTKQHAALAVPFVLAWAALRF